MAAADLNLSRRTLLGAAFAAPVLSVVEGPLLPSAHPERASSLACPERVEGSRCAVEGPPPAATAAWNRALSRFQRAEAALAALEGDADENAYGEAHDRFNLAFRRLLAIPAPDLPALATSLS